MADNYTLVRLDSNIQDRAVLTYDAATDTITDSGLKAYQGEIQANAGTVSVGLQDMSSAGEQVIWTNRASSVNYAPPWHVIDEVNPGGSFDRLYGPIQTITRFAVKTDVLENPSFEVNIPIHEVVFRIVMDFPEAHDNVQFIMSPTGKPDERMWDEFGSVSAGTNTIVLDKPIAFHPGDYTFTIKPYGDVNLSPPVKVMGEAQTGRVGYDVHYREFRDVKLATEEYVAATVTGGPADDVMLKSVFDKDSDGVIDLANNLKGASTSGDSTYYGKDSTGSIGFFPLPAAADEAALKASIKAVEDGVVANQKVIAEHTTAINGHGTQLASNTNQIATNVKNIQTALQTGRDALSESNQVRNMMPNQITADIDHTAKTITLHLISKSGHVDSVLLNLSSWFSGGSVPQPGVTHKLYFGFSQNPPMAEDEILRLSSTKTVDALAGTEITITRQDTAPKYMYVWVPDTAGTVKGFTFSGFLSTWQSTAVNVAGIDGKFYVSPNKTSAQTVTFEVTV